ncbi:MAG: c-type cytochrome [Mariniblastus sp.]|nr:c-type cytochrome [Mariniblastus sp.]
MLTRFSKINLKLLCFACSLLFLVCQTHSSRAAYANHWLDETEAMELLVETIAGTGNPEHQSALMRGMLVGLEGRRNVSLPRGWKKLSQKLNSSTSPTVRELAVQLSAIFGDREAIKVSLTILQNQTANIALRREALRSLLALQSEEASSLLESLLDEPDLRLDAIRGYAMVENATAPALLIQRYKNFSAEHQRAIIETLATRKRYAQALVAACKSNNIATEDVPVHVLLSLRDMIGYKRFNAVYGELKSFGADREKQMTKYKNLLTPTALANGDASRGRAVFNKTCASCHLLYGAGGKVGPDLTGSNRANLDYILLNSIDPSYDVPDGYKMVTVMTVDGRLINGVVEEEDSSKLVLKTAEQPRVVIAKSDIENRKTSDKSIMPDGQLDQMKPQQVIDLIKYLRTTEQVELVK